MYQKHKNNTIKYTNGNIVFGSKTNIHNKNVSTHNSSTKFKNNKSDIKRDIKKDVLNALEQQNFSINDCSWNTNEEKTLGVQSLIKNANTYPNNIKILYEIIDTKKWPVHMKSLECGFTCYHIINWLDADRQILIELYNLVHYAGINVFDTNKYNEDSFQSLMFNKNLSLDEKKFRLKCLCNLNENSIIKITKNIFNKIGSVDKKWMERLKFILIVNYKKTLETISFILVTRKSTISCSHYDKKIDEYISLIITSFQNAETNFKQYNFSENWMKLFVQSSNNKVPNLSELIENIWNFSIQLALNTKDIEIRKLNLEGLGIIIGSFVKKNYLVKEYAKFIDDCLIRSSTKFESVDHETCIKMILRAYNQSKILTKSQKEQICKIPHVNGLLTMTINTLIKEPSKYQQKKSYQQIQIVKKDINSLEFYSNISISNYDDVINDSNNTILDNLSKFNRQAIITRIVICILEKITIKIIFVIKQICDGLKVHFTNDEILNEILNLSDFMKDLRCDNPSVDAVSQAMFDELKT